MALRSEERFNLPLTPDATQRVLGFEAIRQCDTLPERGDDEL